MTPPIDPGREQHIEDLILRSLEAADPRQELASACGNDTSLHEAAQSVLARLIEDHGDLVRGRGAADESKITIAGYRIGTRLGIGGGGVVFRAEQLEPVQRPVALKILKFGMDTDALLQRFQAEQRAVARMNHDHIARVFDAGATADGRPWFAMELVDGPSLTEWSDRNHLDLRQRLQLVLRVCDGLQHAHQKGIVHRDLKPGNLLVAPSDDAGDDAIGNPKIIDFGLARALDESARVHSALTEQGAFLGTPAYMSPEQARGDLDAIDTRTDIYALGAVTYELLVGATPVPAERLRTASPSEIERIVNQEAPLPPSRTAGHHDLPEDLDWIILRALEKEPERRYPSAHEFAADLRRYLDNQPVLARPPSRGYLLRKFVARHRLQVTTGVVIAVSLIIATVVSASMYRRAENHAEAEREAAALARSETRRADATLAEFDMLSTLAHLRDASSAAAELPVTPVERLTQTERWIQGPAARALAKRSQVQATIEALRARARPWDDAAREHDRQSHPMYPSLQRLRQLQRCVRDELAVAAGTQALERPRVDDVLDQLTVMEIACLALELVNRNRQVIGEERRGLVLAERAAVRADSEAPSVRRRALVALAEAQCVVGLYDEAIRNARAALDLADTPFARNLFVSTVARLTDRKNGIDGGERIQKLIGDREREIDRLTKAVETRRTWKFDSPSQSFLHGALIKAQTQLKTFERGTYRASQRSLQWLRQVESVTVHTHADRWQSAREALRAADGKAASTAYSEHPISLDPIPGLVPIGKNPRTGLWEFYHLRSAWDPRAPVDPSSLAIPEHAPDGSLPITPETGIVLILVPGSTTATGSQSADPNTANFDPNARHDELLLPNVSLAPFFIARHELTQGQWLRLGDGTNPSAQSIGETDYVKQRIDGTHPVESVAQPDVVRHLRPHDLELPTEAEWEYACRAGTQTPWWTGAERESLRGQANLADQTAKNRGAPWPAIQDWPDLKDGFVVHGPVHALPANAWGLHHVHGNVAEWCANRYHWNPKAPGSAGYGCRGGSFYLSASHARSAYRANYDAAYNHVGARAYRPLGR